MSLNLFSSIVFLNPLPWYGHLFFLAAILVLLVGTFYRFSTPTRTHTRVILAILRFLILLGVYLVIQDPYWNRSSDMDWLGVVVDTSASMAVKKENSADTRLEELQKILAHDSFWKDLVKKNIRQYFSLDTELKETETADGLLADGKASRLTMGVEEIDRRFQNEKDLLGFILFSDGGSTENDAEIQPDFKKLAFPWITVGLGSEGPVPNLRLTTPEIREQVFVGEIIPLVVNWESTLKENATINLYIKLNGQPFLNRQVQAADKKAEFEFTLTEQGAHRLDIELTTLPTEGSWEDNQITIWLQANPREIRVFYVESFYKNENFFKKALEQDADFRVSFATSLIGFAKEHSVPFIKDPMYGFPGSKDELMQYDVVVLSDVKRSLLTHEQIQWIRELVEQGGGAFVMIGGVDSFGDGGYVGTEIEKMLPVEISEEYKKDTFIAAKGTVENPFRAELGLDRGEIHPMAKIGQSDDETMQFWQTAPLLGGYNYVGRLKPGATMILKHPTDISQFGPRVIMAVQNFGRGKVLAFTSDVTPNWGVWFQEWNDEKGDWLFARFWQKALKWLTENRLRYRAAPIEVVREPGLAEAEAPIEWTVTLPNLSINEQDSQLHLDLYRGEERLYNKEFTNVFGQEKFPWQINRLEPGDYSIRALHIRKNRVPLMVEYPFHVHTSRIEARNLETRHDFLRKIAEDSDGYYLPVEKFQKLNEALQKIRQVHLRQHSVPVWNQWWVYLFFLTLLFVDWFIRKTRGLE